MRAARSPVMVLLLLAAAALLALILYVAMQDMPAPGKPLEKELPRETFLPATR